MTVRVRVEQIDGAWIWYVVQANGSGYGFAAASMLAKPLVPGPRRTT